ncbi:GNAT family acetyltransferase [Bacillus sp. SA1-12]|uniref:GNAT family N-acetyltransferase n=1 Tax=Bacillus sp. SA1-12 TaxID=1455638 RepID=UPI0006271E26|nr:GNAT family protein [Bacillus sp. SA1-12]KKI88723.1 GNAT family acetyltransferase [Bacillus sp. SA1-12]
MKGTELVKIFKAKNGKEVLLRPVKITDAANIVNAVENILEAGTYIQKESPHTIEEEKEFIIEMNQLDNMYVAVELENKVVGIARVIRGELEMKRHTGLFRTWLIDTAQGNGIGSQIMSYTLEWCRLHHLHKLCLTVFASNGLAQKLYERYGFIQEGIQKEQIKINGQFDDEIYMAYFFKE